MSILGAGRDIKFNPVILFFFLIDRVGCPPDTVDVHPEHTTRRHSFLSMLEVRGAEAAV